MSEAREIELGPISDRVGGLDLVVVSPNDPQAMLRHTQECRTRGIPFVADPSQQLAWMDGEQIRSLVDGAAYLFTNAYEAGLLEQKTGWSPEEVLARVGVRVTTLGREGAKVESADGGELARVSTAREVVLADPTGVGDGFRAGFLAGLSWDLPPQRCAELGSMLATYVVETVGPQEYELGTARFLERYAEAYGSRAADDVRPHVRTPRA
jgi:adenosine kinase